VEEEEEKEEEAEIETEKEEGAERVAEEFAVASGWTARELSCLTLWPASPSSCPPSPTWRSSFSLGASITSSLPQLACPAWPSPVRHVCLPPYISPLPIVVVVGDVAAAAAALGVDVVVVVVVAAAAVAAAAAAVAAAAAAVGAGLRRILMTPIYHQVMKERQRGISRRSVRTSRPTRKPNSSERRPKAREARIAR